MSRRLRNALAFYDAVQNASPEEREAAGDDHIVGLVEAVREELAARPPSVFLANLHYAFAKTDGTYDWPNSMVGDLLKQAKRELDPEPLLTPTGLTEAGRIFRQTRVQSEAGKEVQKFLGIGD